MKYYQAILPAIVGASIVGSQPLSAKALSSQEVGKIAEGITVLIDYKDNPGNGSGVIIKKDGNTYTVLTAAHVVANANRKYEIVGNDNQRYPLNYTTVKKLPNQLDLAVVTFISNKNYQVAKIGNSDTSGRGALAYVSGFPGKNAVINESILTITEGKIAGSSNKLNNGYGLVYDITTKGGMSGGAVLNEKGELIGIHGRADSSYDEQTDTIAKSGFNLGIPINTFVRLSTQVGVNTGITLPPVVTNAFKAEDYFVQGNDKYRKQDYKAAIPDFTQAINLNPQYKEAFLRRGMARFRLKNYQQAVADFTQAINLNPQYKEAFLVRGIARFKLKNYQQAIVDFTQVINLNPQYKEAFALRGLARYFLQDNIGAIKDYTQAIKFGDKKVSNYNFRGNARRKTRDYQGAISDYNQVLKLDPNSHDTYNNRAAVRIVLKDYQGAISDTNQAIKISPNYAEAYQYRGEARLKLKDYQAAINDYTQAIKIDPNLAVAYFGKGAARIGLKDFRGAISDFEKAGVLFKQQGNQQSYQVVQNFIELVKRKIR